MLDVIGKFVIPLREKIKWGYYIPYMLSGILDRHPLDAMKWQVSPEEHDYVAFYNEITEEDD